MSLITIEKRLFSLNTIRANTSDRRKWTQFCYSQRSSSVMVWLIIIISFNCDKIALGKSIKGSIVCYL